MSDGWDEFSDLLDTSSLIPDEYARYRPLVAEGLRFFLERLPAERGAEILAEQLALAADAGAIQRVVALIHHSPTLHKLAQVVARHDKLDVRLRRRLQEFESMEPRTPLAEIVPILDRELGDLGRLGIQLGSAPLAEASVAAVVPFTITPRCHPVQAPSATRHGAATRSRKRGDVSSGVLKVLRPGIRERLESELDIWPQLGEFLDERCAAYGLPALDYADAFESMRQLLISEVHLQQEQRHLAEAARIYEGMPGVHVPKLLPFCTSQVTAMERLDGRHVGSLDGICAAVKRALAERIVRAILTVPIWSADGESLFHADPHAGNLLATSDGELGIIDWSLGGRLTIADRVSIMQLMLGAISFDANRVARTLAEVSTVPPNEGECIDVASAALRRIRRGALPGLSWLVRLLDDAVAVAGVRPRSDLLLFRKTVLALEGVVRDVCPQVSVDGVVNASAVEQFAREWPARWVSAPGSRAFGTRMSNADLAGLFFGLPLATARAGLQAWRDGLDRFALLSCMPPAHASGMPW